MCFRGCVLNWHFSGSNCWQHSPTTIMKCKYLGFVCSELASVYTNLIKSYLDDRVRPQTEEEKQLYKLLSDITQRPASSLSSKWREPSLTVHNIEISGPRSRCYVERSPMMFINHAFARRCKCNSRLGEVSGVAAHCS